MFTLFKTKNKLIKELIKINKLPETIFFGGGNLKLSIDTKTILERAFDSDLKNSLSDILMEAVLFCIGTPEMFENVKRFYLDGIEKRYFSIWSNSFYSYGLSVPGFLVHEVRAFLVDQVIDEYVNFGEYSIPSIKDYLNKKITVNEIISHPKSIDRYYHRKFLLEEHNKAYEVIKSHCLESNIKIKKGEDFNYCLNLELENDERIDGENPYLFSNNLNQNLRLKIGNFDDILKSMRNKVYTIKNHKGVFVECHLNDNIDFNNMLDGTFLFNLKERDSISVSFNIMNNNSSIHIHNVETMENGTDDEYDFFFSLVKL